MVAPFVTAKRAKIEGGTYEADFPLQWMRKDLHLASITAYEQGVALPAGNVVKEIYALAEQYGLGEKDFSAIYQFLEAEA
jgi:3-hydroxyisobutyrate dehydrogenase-like beta-hydroxyacid dehydrogenase